MSYAIVYSSRTGNTALLAQAIRESLPQEECLHFGGPDSKALAAETIYVGFWTDKGSCDEETSRYFCSAQPDLEALPPISSRFWGGFGNSWGRKFR